MPIKFNPVTGNLDLVPSTDADYLNYTPATSANWPTVPSKVAQALDSLASLVNYKNPLQVYVDASNGSDSTGTGAEPRPYQTLQYAVSVLSSAAAGDYVIFLAPGTYSGSTINWPVQANKSISVTCIRNTATISAQINYTSTGASDETFLMDGVNVSTRINFDLGLGGIVNIILSNGQYPVKRTDSLPPGPQSIRIINSFADGFDTDSVLILESCQFVGGPYSNRVRSNGLTLLQSCLFASMSAQVDGNLFMLGTLGQGSTITGTGTVTADVSALVNLTVTGPTLIYFDEASGIKYSPSTPGDWSTVPTKVSQALDLLANTFSGFVPSSRQINGYALTSDVNLTKTDVGLGNVDNTSDLDKPISTSTQSALDGKEDLTNKSNDTSLSSDSSTLYPTQHAVKTYADTKVEANSVIVGGTYTKITYDSKGLITTGANASLNDLSDVVISSPVTDQLLKYNGTSWVNSSGAVVNAGPGVTYFLSTTSGGIAGYETISKTPDTAAEVDETVVVNNNTVLLHSYISDSAIGKTTVDPGIWEFNYFTYVDTLHAHVFTEVYTRTSSGVETFLFSAESLYINWTSVQLVAATTVQPEFSCNATDKLVIKVYGTTTETSNVTLHILHSGTQNYSHFHTPLVLSHNEIAGLQGGTSNQYYHLTNAEYTGIGTGAFVRNSTLSSYVPTTRQINGYALTSDINITKSDVGLGNVDNTSDINKPVSTAQQAAINKAAYYFAIVL
jgi:hypothetical protein